MSAILAVTAWVLVAFFAGVVPGMWLIVTDHILSGVLVFVAGYGLGALAAEGIIRLMEGPRQR